ncbi:hypothetical protein BaRGS_00005053 [Batillaria attramentaria]|uniref:Uncharacterized protein n=1 Tax=Batillaria attramentaria TaxID=370345 RepID=A0ABD0LWU4_9CAEN
MPHARQASLPLVSVTGFVRLKAPMYDTLRWALTNAYAVTLKTGRNIKCPNPPLPPRDSVLELAEHYSTRELINCRTRFVHNNPASSDTVTPAFVVVSQSCKRQRATLSAVDTSSLR